MPNFRRRLMSTLGGLAAAITVTAGTAPANAAISDPAPAATARAAMPQGAPYQPVKAQPKLTLPTKPYPVARTLAIKGQYQSGSMWCVPTSSAVSLGTVGVSVGQSTLAAKMHADDGTTPAEAVPVLNSYANKKLFTYTAGFDVSTGPQMMAGVITDVGVLNKAPILRVWAEDLPWSTSVGSDVGHAIVVYGYDLSANTVTVWDPWKPTGGKHVLTADRLAAASQPLGLYLITPGTTAGTGLAL